MSSNPRRTADRLAPAPNLRRENATVGASRAPGDGPADPAPGAPTITVQPALAHKAGLADRSRRREDAGTPDGRAAGEYWPDGRGVRGGTSTSTTGSSSERETVGESGIADMSLAAHPAGGDPARDHVARTPRRTATGSLSLEPPPSVNASSKIESSRAPLPPKGSGTPYARKR